MKPWLIFLLGFLSGIFFSAVTVFIVGIIKYKKSHAAPIVSVTVPTSPGGAPVSVEKGDSDIVALLNPIRLKYHLPALGGTIVESAGVKAMGVDGVRKRGETDEVSINDLWHLGSDTKAMTATMIAALVEKGKISWDSKLGDIFPDIKLPSTVQKITLLELLTHRAGLPANTDWRGLAGSGSLVNQRKAAVAQLSSVELLSSPGSKFSYSNWGYVTAAAMAEKVTGMSYEDLMRTMLFEPLQMHTVGYGAAGNPGKMDEPWGHTADGTAYQADNPLIMAPAGGLHCSLDDWGKFIVDQLRGAEGKPALLKPDSYSRLHSAPFEGSYALGWGVANRPWGGGQVFTHAGSNTMNMAVVWMAPARDFAVLVVCNQGDAGKACDDVCAGLIALRKMQTIAKQPNSN